jgi:hypothetical protein
MAANDTVDLDGHDFILAYLEVFSDETPQLTEQEEKEKDALYSKIIGRNQPETIPTPTLYSHNRPKCRDMQSPQRSSSTKKNTELQTTLFSLILSFITFGLANPFGERSRSGKRVGQRETVS